MISAACVAVASSSMPARTVAGEPTKMFFAEIGDNGAFRGRKRIGHGVLGIDQRGEFPAGPAHRGEIERRRQEICLLVGLRTDRRDGQDQMRRRAMPGRLEILAISARGGHHPIGAEMMGKAKAETESRRQSRAEIARAQNPDRRQRHVVGQGAHAGQRMPRRKFARAEREQFIEQIRKFVARHPLHRSPQRQRRTTIGTRRAAESQVDPSRKERLQHAKIFRHAQGRVIRQHDSARAHPNAAGGARHLANHHLRRRAHDARQVVVLRQPEAMITEVVRQGAEVDGILQRPTAGRARGVRGEVKNGERQGHGEKLGPVIYAISM